MKQKLTTKQRSNGDTSFKPKSRPTAFVFLNFHLAGELWHAWVVRILRQSVQSTAV